MSGKLFVILLLAAAMIGGAAMYYLQVYGFYEEMPPGNVDLRIMNIATGTSEPLLADNLRAIDATSSPLRFRACFDGAPSLALMTETYQIHETPVPLNAPGWFDCFDAGMIGASLENDEALAFLGSANDPYGIARVIAVMPDGRGFVWHQINHCGEEVFDGNPPPPGCPPTPERN